MAARFSTAPTVLPGALGDAAVLASLLADLRTALASRYEILGWVASDLSRPLVLLARETSTGRLLPLRLDAEGGSARGARDAGLTVVLTVLPRFAPDVVTLGGACESCRAPRSGWDERCAHCNAMLEPPAELFGAVLPSKAALLDTARRLAGDEYEILGDIPEAPGTAYFVRQRSTGQLGAARIRWRQPDSLTDDPYPELSVHLFAGKGSPHSGPVGPLGSEGPEASGDQRSRADSGAAPARRKLCPRCGATYDADSRFCPRDGGELRFEGAGDPLIGETLAGRYRVLRTLGAGGMGRVYLAEHLVMKRRDAVKVMLPALASDPDAVRRFEREATNAARVRHANVATIYDFGAASDGSYFLAMEYVEGPTLRELLQARGALPVATAVRIASQIADALHAAHGQREPIIHRDLKPDNVLLAVESGEDPAVHGVVKVVDFGIARAMSDAGQKVSRSGVIIGTPAYMSPEQLAGKHLDARSDVYALGCVLYEMLVGEPAFPGDSFEAIIGQKLADAPPRVRARRAEVTTELDDLVARCMERAAAERFPSTAELRRALGEAVAEKPKADPARHDRQPPDPVGTERSRDRGSLAVSPTRFALGAERVVPILTILIVLALWSLIWMP